MILRNYPSPGVSFGNEASSEIRMKIERGLVRIEVKKDASEPVILKRDVNKTG